MPASKSFRWQNEKFAKTYNVISMSHPAWLNKAWSTKSYGRSHTLMPIDVATLPAKELLGALLAIAIATTCTFLEGY